MENIFVKYLQIGSFIIDCYELRSNERGVAQLGSAGALGALGRRFESCRPDHLIARDPSPCFFISRVSQI